MNIKLFLYAIRINQLTSFSFSFSSASDFDKASASCNSSSSLNSSSVFLAGVCKNLHYPKFYKTSYDVISSKPGVAVLKSLQDIQQVNQLHHFLELPVACLMYQKKLIKAGL